MKRLVLRGSELQIRPGQFFDQKYEILCPDREVQAASADYAEKLAAAQIGGDVIDLGRCPEPIEWIVLAKEEGRALLLAREAVEAASYNSANNKKAVTWEKSRIRAWLNGPFFSMSFAREEQEKILVTKKQDAGQQQDRRLRRQGYR